MSFSEAVPAPVRAAVRLMYAGAAVYAIGAVAGLVVLFSASPPVSGAPAGVPLRLVVLDLVIGGPGIVLPVVLWLWLAWKCRAGRRWARIVSTVLFALSTLMMLAVGPTGGWAVLGLDVIWLSGLAVISLLWQRSSSRFFRAASRY